MFLPLSSSRHVAVQLQGASSRNDPGIAPLCRVYLVCFVCPFIEPHEPGETPAETKKTTGRRAKIQLTRVFASRLAMADLCVVQ